MEIVRRKLAPSRAAAKDAIAAGLVEVGGIRAAKAATMVDESTSLRLRKEARRFASRGGDKLEAALSAFAVDVKGARALDIGASTGGFTDCLLQHGAKSVVALDVGYGQLAWQLRNDERVTVLERTNFRHADPRDLGAPFDVVVADLSFISLRMVARQLRSVGATPTEYILLVKPQFEVGKDEVGAGGIVKDPELHASALIGVVAALEAEGIGCRGALASPLTGTKGNREFLLWARVGPGVVDAGVIEEVTAK